MKIEIGLKIGCLTVLEKAKNIGKYTAWFCRCDCGNEKVIKTISLTTGRTATCGCKMNKFPNNDPKLSSAVKFFNYKYKEVI
jgi:hypothetical protein